MNSYSYSHVKSINKNKMHKKRKRRYRIISYKRFICSNLVLCFLVFTLITIINNLGIKEVNGQEEQEEINFKPTMTVEPKPISSSTTEYIAFASELPSIRSTTFEMHVSRGGIGRNIKKYSDEEVQVETTSVSNAEFPISKEERRLLEQLAEAEAAGESLVGKIAVINVVLNRVKSEDFPNTITEVIMQEGQFTPVANGSINNTPSEESILAVKKAIDEGYKVFGTDVLYFCNKKTATNRWMIENREEVITIGNHTFFR